MRGDYLSPDGQITSARLRDIQMQTLRKSEQVFYTHFWPFISGFLNTYVTNSFFYESKIQNDTLQITHNC